MHGDRFVEKKFLRVYVSVKGKKETESFTIWASFLKIMPSNIGVGSSYVEPYHKSIHVFAVLVRVFFVQESLR